MNKFEKILVVLLLIISMTTLIVIQSKLVVQGDYNAYTNDYNSSDVSGRGVTYFNLLGSNVNEREVIFTNYGTWDGTSGNTTAYGYKIKDFEINEDGMYTLNGYVVLATAHSTIPGLRKGFITHEREEIINFEMNDKTYKGIVLDKCGGCTYGYKNEDLQRVDIFTVSNSVKKKVGVIIE